MKSIRWRLVFMYLSLVFIVMILTGTFIIVSTENREQRKASEELRQCAVYIEEQVIGQYDNRYFQDSLINLSIVSSTLRNMSAHILNSRGKTIASSTVADEADFQQYTNSAVISALNGKESFLAKSKITDSIGQEKTVMSYSYPCKDSNGNVLYIVYVQMDSESIEDSIAQTTRTILVASAIALVITAILGFLFANTITTPIAALTKKANLMAKGRLDQKVTVKGNDEIGQLTKSFNIMAKELRKTIVESEEQRNKLEIVLHNMTDGILAFDEGGQLIQINRSSYDMLEIDDVKISLKWFLDMLKIDMSQFKSDSVKELVVNGKDDKYISVAIIPYSLKKKKKQEKRSGTIAVLHDITKHRQLDNMRQEFVANVSHEIGTPLTTIKGYAELLLDGAIDDKTVAMEFLKEINVAADRMKILRDDLLDLSRFDTKVNKLNMEDVNLVSLVSGCCRQNLIVAENKNQSIVFDPPEKPMFIYADPGRINQVITNIMSNAMKYSDNKATINIKLKETGKYYHLEIQDNGIGMPKEALDRIFDRFYRVDKARSRAMGGNGLGLAIVKEIMDAHNGSIKVYSTLGVGTTMVLIFPKSELADYIIEQ
ncbi:MAG: ATP-binding protein [Clostridia bacterium]|nr:ATP-binding protein [Clostridia bacterium]